MLYGTGTGAPERALAAIAEVRDARRPALLVLDDADRAPAEVRAAARELGAALAGVTALVVATGQEAAALARLGPRDSLRLEPLDAEAVRSIAALYAPSADGDAVPQTGECSGLLAGDHDERSGAVEGRAELARSGANLGRRAVGVVENQQRRPPRSPPARSPPAPPRAVPSRPHRARRPLAMGVVRERRSQARLAHPVAADDATARRRARGAPPRAQRASSPSRPAAAPRPRLELARQDGASGATSSEASWRRIASCSRRSSGPGSTPICSTSMRRAAGRPPAPRPGGRSGTAPACAGRAAARAAGARRAAPRSRRGPPRGGPRPGPRRCASSAAAAAAPPAGGSPRPRTARRRGRPADRRGTGASASRAAPPRCAAPSRPAARGGASMSSRIDAQLVAAPARDDLRLAVLGQHPAQPPDVGLHHLRRARRRLARPTGPRSGARPTPRGSPRGRASRAPRAAWHRRARAGDRQRSPREGRARESACGLWATQSAPRTESNAALLRGCDGSAVRPV